MPDPLSPTRRVVHLFLREAIYLLAFTAVLVLTVMLASR